MSRINGNKKPIAIFSGGGTRFASYVGMYAAMEDLGIKPDVVIATCGGAISTAIINSFSNNAQRKAYLQSDEFFNFVKTERLTQHSRLDKIGWYCLQKVFNKEKAPTIENVFDNFIVNMPNDLSKQLPSLSMSFNTNIKSVFIGSELLFSKNQVGHARNGKALYQKVLFTDPETAANIDLEKINIQSESYKNTAIHPQTKIISDITVPMAMRISISDMFYMQPAQYNGQHYLGGAIDLVPLELSQALGDTIIMEQKQSYSRVEEALVRSVFGFSGNERLGEINNTLVNHSIDTRSIEKELQNHYVKKYIEWTKFKVNITLPQSHLKFKKDMEVQWAYGYNKVKNSLKP